MTSNRRKSDKTISVNLVITIFTFLISVILAYIIIPINSRIDHIENKQDKFISYYLECKEDINKLREQYNKDFHSIKDNIKKEIDDLIAWIKENGKIL